MQSVMKPGRCKVGPCNYMTIGPCLPIEPHATLSQQLIGGVWERKISVARQSEVGFSRFVLENSYTQTEK